MDTFNFNSTFILRKSVRAYRNKPVPEDLKSTILGAALRAPTAGNMMLYTIIEIADQGLKVRLAETCDHQPFIAKAPWVLLFLADYQRVYDYFKISGVEEWCAKRGEAVKKPEESDLLLAGCDALIAAQTAVAAAEAHGLGSCYIGDILENYEIHRDLLDLPPYVMPLTMVCFGYPTEGQIKRKQPARIGQKYMVHTDKYRRLTPETADEIYHSPYMTAGPYLEGCLNAGQHMYKRKFSADFSVEMRRSVKKMLEAWR